MRVVPIGNGAVHAVKCHRTGHSYGTRRLGHFKMGHNGTSMPCHLITVYVVSKTLGRSCVYVVGLGEVVVSEVI